MAVIGYSCCFPGGIDSPEKFWQLLKAGGSVIGEVPDSRLSREFHYAPADKNARGKSYSTVGACINYDLYRNRIDDFTATLPFAEALSHDEGHLLSLYVAAEALCSAGYDPRSISHRQTGVYLGYSRVSKATVDTGFTTCIEPVIEYLEDIPEFMKLQESTRKNVLNNVLDAFFLRYPPLSPVNRKRLWTHYAAKNISKAFGLSGPSMIINGACASSLISLALAADALRQDKIDMAIVGGASYLKFDSIIHFSHAQSMSLTGSKPFDTSADGLAPSEGHAYVILKTMESALKSGDKILAVIHGVGISSDGKGKGLWAPRKEGQMKALQRAYCQTRSVTPADLDYIEAHATSTKLGDATELDAIHSFIRNESTSIKPIPIGSCKANLGHTLESAGLAGLIKVLLSMKNGTIPAQINVDHLTDSFSWEDAAITVPMRDVPWKKTDKSCRTAAVNAFGIGGMNAHVVLQDYSPSPKNKGEKTKNVQHKSQTDMPIAVIGMGCVLPGVSDLTSFETLLRTGDDLKTTAPPDRRELFVNNRYESKRYNKRQNAAMRQQKGGYLNDYAYDWKRHKIPPIQVKYANPLQFMILDAVEKALEDAGFSTDSPLPTDTTAVIVGSRFDSDYTNAMQVSLRCPELEKEIVLQLKEQGVDSTTATEIAGNFSKILLDRHPALKDETGSFTTVSLAARIIKTYNLMGGSMVIDSGSCSSFAALETAVHALREGRIDLAICVGGQQSMGRLTLEEMLLHDGDLFPLAEGACVLILQRQEDAQREDNRIRAQIHGISCRQGDDIAATTQLSIKAAMDSSAPKVESIKFLEMASPDLGNHVTGIEQALFSSLKRKIPLTSLPRKIGNLLGASGIAAVIKSIIELEKGSCSSCALVTNVDRDGTVCSLIVEKGQGVPCASVISREHFVSINTSIEGQPPIRVGATVCHRFVQRIVPAGLPAQKNAVPEGHVLLFGQNAVLEHLYHLIKQNGGTAHRLNPAAPVEPMLRRLDTLFDKEPIRHIVFLTSHDSFRTDTKNDKLDPQIWQRTLEEAVYRPFQVLQHWLGRIKTLGLLEQVSVIMSTLLGGDFGYTQPVGGPEGGAAQGLMKALRRELGVYEKIIFHSRIVDHHQDVPAEQIAADLFQELVAQDIETEIGYVDNRRYTSRPILSPVNTDEVVKQETTAQHRFTGNWIFTGGAQGITAVAAREFGKRFGGTLHLIGSTKREPIDPDWVNYDDTQRQNLRKQIMKDALSRKEIPSDAWRRVEKFLGVEKNLHEMQRLGINVSYHSCDLTDGENVQRTIRAIVADGGPIVGVIHGAGFESSSKFEKKKRENIARTIEVKVCGSANLLRCLDRHSLRYFVGFGSTSGRFGGVGQSDYSAANEMLAKLLEWYRSLNPDCRTACMQWTAWDDVGMAVRPESKSALTAMNRKFLPSLEGAKHLLDELVLDLPESEVTIVDWEYYKRFFPDHVSVPCEESTV